MIRIALVDDHPALAAGLTAVLAAEPDLEPVGTATDREEAEPLLYRTRPDLVIVDYHLPKGDGLQLCRRIKADVPAPWVLVYSAYADAWLGFVARAAGADGVGSKAAPARELLELIRRVAAGERVLPAVTAEQLHTAAERLGPDDAPLLSLLLDGTSPTDTADILRIDPDALPSRIDSVLGRLRADLASV